MPVWLVSLKWPSEIRGEQQRITPFEGGGKGTRIPRHDNEVSSAKLRAAPLSRLQESSRSEMVAPDPRPDFRNALARPPTSRRPSARSSAPPRSLSTLFRARNSLIPLAARRGRRSRDPDRRDSRGDPRPATDGKKFRGSALLARPRRQTAAAAARQTDADRRIEKHGVPFLFPSRLACYLLRLCVSVEWMNSADGRGFGSRMRNPAG